MSLLKDGVEAAPAGSITATAHSTTQAMAKPEQRNPLDEALSLGDRVARDGAFTSRRGSGDGLLPFASRRIQPKNRISSCRPRARPALADRPLTRRASADESAGARHPLPRGEGCVIEVGSMVKNKLLARQQCPSHVGECSAPRVGDSLHVGALSFTKRLQQRGSFRVGGVPAERC
jgi:hypothetical protein